MGFLLQSATALTTACAHMDTTDAELEGADAVEARQGTSGFHWVFSTRTAGGTLMRPISAPLLFRKHVELEAQGQGCIGKGGGGNPPIQGAQPMPSHRPPDGKRQLQWRLQPTVSTQPLRQPPPTACLTVSGAASEVPAPLLRGPRVRGANPPHAQGWPRTTTGQLESSSRALERVRSALPAPVRGDVGIPPPCPTGARGGGGALSRGPGAHTSHGPPVCKVIRDAIQLLLVCEP